VTDQQKQADQWKPHHQWETTGVMRDPIGRAIAAQEWVRFAESRRKQARKAFRDARDAGLTIQKIARQTGINPATVKAATR
jgi:hypothetical protein